MPLCVGSKDQEALTIIVPLNGLETFEGGGTAFWDEDALDPNHDAKPRTDADPSLLLLEPPGTAVVFAGYQVCHAANAVVSGERFVLVASFSACDSDCE